MTAHKRAAASPAAQSFYTRRADLRGVSFEPKTGFFSAVAASGAPIRRAARSGGYYTEILSMVPGAVRLGRLQSGAAPILDSHRFGTVRDQIGVVTAARIEGGKLMIDARLSRREDVKPIAADIAGGTPPNVSVGYRVYASEESRDANGDLVITHTDWEPVEVSLVAIGADSQAHIRSEPGVTTMDDEVIETEVIGAEKKPTAPRQSIEASRNRMMSDSDARTAFRMAALAHQPADFAQRHIDTGVTLDQFRALLFDKMHEDASNFPTSPVARDGGGTFGNPEFLSRAIEGALYARMSGKAPEGPATELMGRTMLDMGAMLLEARGERVRWLSRDSIASQMLETRSGAHSASDFPILLTGAGNRILQDAYKAAECPLKALAKRRDASDFRAISLLKLSEAPTLDEVNEGGEIKYGSRAETKEGFAVKTYAKIFALTRQAIINDDLGAFADANSAWGRAAAETEANLIVSLFAANGGNGANLDDGNPLYTTGRKNKANAGGAIDITTLGAGRQAMRETKSLDGKTPISVTPKHLVVGAAKETEAEQVLASIAAAQVSNANPFAGKLTLHVEPRLTGNAWRLFADPAEIATIIIAYLNGQAGPILSSREGWSTLGAEFRAVLDFGCGLADWRGTYLNPGS